MNNALELESRADMQRAKGLLHDAALLYKELLSIIPDHLKADRLFSSIGGPLSTLQGRAGGLKAATFIVKKHFLPEEVHDALLAALLLKIGEFIPAQTVKGPQLDYRRSRIRPNGLEQLDFQIEQCFFESLLKVWDQAGDRLRVPKFTPLLSETHVLLYSDGDFFRPHRDTGSNNTRRVTFAYSLHQKPRRFRGGDLLLYDTYFVPGMGQGNQRFNPETYTRLGSEDNQLILFPSEFYHEVTPVSGLGDNIRDARFVINGWFHTTANLGDLDFISYTPY